jgi:hypothetical protein
MKELKDGGEKNIFKGVSAYAVRERISEAVHTQSPYFKSYTTQESKKKRRSVTSNRWASLATANC